MKIFVAGGTGLIGKRLVGALLARGDSVTVLSRSATKAAAELPSGVQVLEGDVLRDGPWQTQVALHDAVVNLVGEAIADNAWTAGQKQRLVDSRLKSTASLVRALQGASSQVRTLVQASAVGYYGDCKDTVLSENSAPGQDFLARLCVDWEAEGLKARSCRVVLLRTGIVLDLNGGALAKLKGAFQLFAGGPLGSGTQYFPWIHADDLVGLILMSLDRSEVHGPLNGVAPESLTLSAFSRVLGQVMKRPSWLPVPAFALRLGLGERADMLLASQRVVPERALALGYVFRYPTLEPALRALFQAG